MWNDFSLIQLGTTKNRRGIGLALIFILSLAILQSGCAGMAGSQQPGGGPGPQSLTVSNASAGNVTTTGAAVSWQTNMPATSQIEFGTSTSYGTTTALDASLVVSHQQAMSGLNAATQYHFRVRSRDANNNEALSNDMTVTTSATPDTTAPTVSITSPAANATVSGTISVTATASDNVGVAGVQFKVDNANTGAQDTSAAYSYLLDTRTLSNGNHSLTAVARDAAGNTTTSGGVTISVNNVSDTTAPTVSITAPASGASVSGTISVSANASDNVAVAGVQFKLDGSNIGAEDTSSPYGASLNTATVSNGNHTLTAVARDSSSNTTTSAGVTIGVNNASDTTAPTVSVTSPAAGASVSGTISLTATASDNVGIAGVQFRLDGSNLGTEDTSTPYTISWNTTGASNGNHTLTARARDAAGNQTTSANVVVTVSNASQPPPSSGSSISSLASTMQPGTWAVLNTNGFNSGALLSTGDPSDYITQFSDNAAWDPIRKQLHFVGTPHGQTYISKHIVYDDATNNWSEKALPPGSCEANPPCVSHAYDHNTADPATGDYYLRHYNSPTIYHWSSSSQSWASNMTIPGSSFQVAGALGAFPDRNSLVFVDGDYGVQEYNLGSRTWTFLANTAVVIQSGKPTLPMGSYHNFIQYNPVLKVVVFGGGNDSRMYKMNASGQITTLKNAPFSVGVTSTQFSVDPANGKYIVITSGRTMYEYDVAADSWKALSVQAPFSNPGDGAIQAPISNYGVIMYVKYDFGSSKVYLYKHSGSAGTPPPPAGDTTSPTVSMTAPANGATASGTTTVSASASDNVGVVGVQFHLDGADLGQERTAAPYSISWDTTLASNGTHTVTAEARDAAGNHTTSVAASVNVSNGSAPPPSASDFQTRCAAAGVVLCQGFDDATALNGSWGDNSGTLPGSSPIVIDNAMRASGSGSMKFTIASQSSAGSAGSWFTNFSNDLSVQFGPGQEFYVQWRQRFSPEFLNTFYTGGGGWKQQIIGEGDRAGVCDPNNPTSATCSTSCTQLEVVTQNSVQRELPQMYHSCGGKDGRYEPLEYFDNALGNVVVQNAVGCLYPTFAAPPCVKYQPNEWMTFQVHIKIGTWYLNNGTYHRDSTVQLWVAREGQPSTLVLDFSPQSGHGYDLANSNPALKYGKLWLLPYHTGKDSSQVTPTGYTWYDELIISRTRIPDPN